MLTCVVGAPVESPKRINIFELEVTGMSGDADGYHKNSVFREKFEELVPMLRILDGVKGYSRDKARDFVKEKAAELVREYGLSDGYRDLCSLDCYTDLVGWDVKYEGLDAALEGFKVFFYDFDGVKRFVSVSEGTKHIC